MRTVLFALLFGFGLWYVIVHATEALTSWIQWQSF